MAVTGVSGAISTPSPAFNSEGAYTVVAWLKIAELDSASIYLAQDDDDFYDNFEINAGAELFLRTEVTNVPDTHTVPNGVWGHWSVVRANATSFVATNDLADSASNTGNTGSRNANFDYGEINIGGASSICYMRVWTAALSAPEIAAEMASAVPVRTANLWADWPLEVYTDLTDHSGNGRDLSGGGGGMSTDAEGPLGSSGGGTLTPTVWANKWALDVLTV